MPSSTAKHLIMPPPKVIIIFGAGANTGLATARKFAAGGYKIAAVSRHPSEELKRTAHLIIAANLKDASQLTGVFEKVTRKLGAPHVVVYNAADDQLASSTNPLEVPPRRLEDSLAVNTISPYTAAHIIVRLWASLPDDGTISKTFLYTGDTTNSQLHPGSMTLGVGKNASAYWLETAAAAYKGRYKFYFVDERTPEGESTMGAIDGEAHAEEFWRLAEVEKGQQHWCWTFVKGQGYTRNKLIVNRELRDMDLPGLPEGGVAADDVKEHAKANPAVAKALGLD